ncbi:unnamed protein product [Kuraishia capsulata CBS 1993]|uniref:Uncharacterized protein n=1 Tax=Kuraishia capsulata CBS 1993 TaxID=1382522 RepID=W6MJK6_9ASCO|nr:uncharacterized protein KUCA_T00002698001 [Kuraishia capsulata CBS 1993]CDK26724.1 unnamed protein product [Kuraishia capsulata CBS 1993]
MAIFSRKPRKDLHKEQSRGETQTSAVRDDSGDSDDSKSIENGENSNVQANARDAFDDASSVNSEETVFNNALRNMGLLGGLANQTFYTPPGRRSELENVNPSNSDSESESDSDSMNTLHELVGPIETPVQIVIPTVFNRPADSFNIVRNMPVVSGAFKIGVLVFASEFSLFKYKSLEKLKAKRKKPGNEAEIKYISKSDIATPLLHAIVPTLSVVRKNCPYMILYKFYEEKDRLAMEQLKLSNPTEYKDFYTDKYVICKVYSKFLKCGVKRYVLEMYPKPNEKGVQANYSSKIVMFTHRGKPYTDVLYKGTKIRWLGTSVITSPYASTSFEMVIQNKSPSAHLHDGITDDDKPDPANPLLHDDTTVGDVAAPIEYCRKYRNSTLPIFAQYNDSPHELALKKFRIQGTVACYERMNNANAVRAFKTMRYVTNDTIIVTIMAMVLREQEGKKSHNAISKRAQRVALEHPSQVYYSPFTPTM